MGAASGAMRRSARRNSRAFAERSSPTFTSGTISQSSGNAASSALSAYVIPPHSSTGSSRGSRPWMMSQTKVPMTPKRRLALDPIQNLLFERRHGSHDSRRPRQRSRQNAARLHRRTERAAAHLRTQWLEQRLPCLRHAASDDDDVGVEDVEQIRDAGAEEIRGLTNDLSRDVVVPLRRV